MAYANTKQMFLERVCPADRDKFKPKYSIQEYDVLREGVTYKSMYLLYMSSVDEYDFATTHLGDVHLWEHLLKTQWFIEGFRSHRGIDAWREDMRARDESLAMGVLQTAVKKGDINAAKKLFDVSRRPAETRKQRVAKDQFNKQVTASAKDKEFLDSAALRLNVVSIRD